MVGMFESDESNGQTGLEWRLLAKVTLTRKRTSAMGKSPTETLLGFPGLLVSLLQKLRLLVGTGFVLLFWTLVLPCIVGLPLFSFRYRSLT